MSGLTWEDELLLKQIFHCDTESEWIRTAWLFFWQ